MWWCQMWWWRSGLTLKLLFLWPASPVLYFFSFFLLICPYCFFLFQFNDFKSSFCASSHSGSCFSAGSDLISFYFYAHAFFFFFPFLNSHRCLLCLCALSSCSVSHSGSCSAFWLLCSCWNNDSHSADVTLFSILDPSSCFSYNWSVPRWAQRN